MYLSKISGRSFKGGDFDVELSRATVLHGDNFAGKTRIADAVRLLLIGHLPELGKLPRSTFELASGPVLLVSGVLSDGVVDYALSRKFWLEGDTVKSEANLPDVVKTSTLLTVMLNAEAYFALSDRDRVDYVFANLGLTVSREQVLDRIKKATEEHPGKVRDELLACVEEDESDGKPLNDTAQKVVDGLINTCGAIWKREKDHAKRMEQTIQGLTALRAQDARFRPVAEAHDELAGVERKLTEIATEKGRLMNVYLQMKTANHRRGEITREIATTDKDRLALVDLEAKLGLLVAELEKFPAALPPRSDLEAAVARATADYNPLRDQIIVAKKRIAAIDVEKSELSQKKCCPYCGSAGFGWAAVLEDQLTREAAKLADYVKTAESELVVLCTALDNALAARLCGLENLRKVEDIRFNMGSVQEKIGTVKPRLARADALREELARLIPDDPELEQKVSELQAVENLRSAEKRGLLEEIAKANAREAEKTRLASAEKERDDAAKDQDTAKSIGEILREIQSELVEAAFRPLLDTANAIFGPVLKTPLAYHNGEIGTRRDGVWVGHKTFSGTEKALAYAAIQCALAAKSPVRFMLLDELGRLTFDNAELVARAILNAIEAGHLDQFLGIDPERPALYATINGPGKESAFSVLKIG